MRNGLLSFAYPQYLRAGPVSPCESALNQLARREKLDKCVQTNRGSFWMACKGRVKVRTSFRGPQSFGRNPGSLPLRPASGSQTQSSVLLAASASASGGNGVKEYQPLRRKEQHTCIKHRAAWWMDATQISASRITWPPTCSKLHMKAGPCHDKDIFWH